MYTHFQTHSFGGFLKWGVPLFIIHFRLGFSMKSTIQLLGYPHDYGTPHLNLNEKPDADEQLACRGFSASAANPGHVNRTLGANMATADFGDLRRLGGQVESTWLLKEFTCTLWLFNIAIEIHHF